MTDFEEKLMVLWRGIKETEAELTLNELIRRYRAQKVALEEIIKLGQESSEEFSIAYQALEQREP